MEYTSVWLVLLYNVASGSLLWGEKATPDKGIEN